jgi:zinc D-Ala-D-Ala carboxypeptidase
VFQPKRQSPTKGINLSQRAIISAFSLVLALFIGTDVALAATPTPTPTPTPSSSPTPTAIPDPNGFNTPTPMPTTPIVCGAGCFNPSLYSIDQAASLWVVVNKTRPLSPLTYKPKLDASINLAVPAADGFRKLKAALSKSGNGTLCLNSGYRSFNTQTYTYNTDVARYGKKVAETLAAHPGYSEHQTGLAADVSTTALGCKITNFGSSKASSWIVKNAYQYGFIVRYPIGETATTGYQYEPWHLRFVGVALATQMKMENITVLEKFWQLPAAPNYKN